MEVFILISLVLIIYILVKFKDNTKLRFDDLQHNLDFLHNELKRLETLSQVSIPSGTIQADTEPARHHLTEEIIIQTEEPVIAPEAIVEKVFEQKLPETIPEPIRVEEPQGTISHPVVEEIERVSFWNKYPDIERFIGENLVNKIGIAVLVLGMGFFLKYAIDQNWINEIGRTCIGLFTGGALVGIAHYLRNTYRSFSSVLIGGGIAIMYFAITIAFHQYHLFGQGIAFTAIVAITSSAVVLSLSYDRIELCAFAVLGGFCAPILVSSGEGNYIILFTYLLILNGGMLVISYFKKWNLVNQICFVLTLIIYSYWLSSHLIQPNNVLTDQYWGALVFAILFYLAFFAMTIINNIKEKTPFNAFQIIQLLGNTAYWFGMGVLILNRIENGLYLGLFTIFMAILNFSFTFSLYKNKKTDPNLLYLLIGLTLTFVSLTAPIQLKGNYITLFWSCESLLIIWLAYKSGLKLLRNASVILIVLLTISLVWDWINNYSLQPSELTRLMPINNKAFITTTFAVLGIVGYITLMKRYFTDEKISTFYTNQYLKFVSILAVLLAYFGMFLELNYQGQFHFPDIRIICIGYYNYIVAIILLRYLNRSNDEISYTILLFSLAVLAAFVLLYNRQVIFVRNSYITHSTSAFNFWLHYPLSILFVVTLRDFYINGKSFFQRFGLDTFSKWFTIASIIYLVSAELDHATVYSFGSNSSIDKTLNITHRAGYAILWGVCSFVLMYFGLKRKSKLFRIASLSLFGITLLKLFLFDMGSLSEGGKIAAFISLGVILLVVSFMYQKLRTLLLDNGTENDVIPNPTPNENAS